MLGSASPVPAVLRRGNRKCDGPKQFEHHRSQNLQPALYTRVSLALLSRLALSEPSSVAVLALARFVIGRCCCSRSCCCRRRCLLLSSVSRLSLSLWSCRRRWCRVHRRLRCPASASRRRRPSLLWLWSGWALSRVFIVVLIVVLRSFVRVGSGRGRGVDRPRRRRSPALPHPSIGRGFCARCRSSALSTPIHRPCEVSRQSRIRFRRCLPRLRD